MNRRQFIRIGSLAGGALAASAWLPSCADSRSYDSIPGTLSGPDHRSGHRLRQTSEPVSPSRILETPVLIIGGGIAGLSARRRLSMQQHEVLLLELEEECGGNSRSGHNDAGAYPLGAHYLPLPDLRNRELLDFLQQSGVILGYNAGGEPLYNDYYLCHDPEERLFLKGRWQEGLVPDFGISDAERQQIRQFQEEMDRWKQHKGNDGLDAFAIPLSRCSQDSELLALDSISFRSYLEQKGWTAPSLLWYLDYCCKDDYGLDSTGVSAWAGLHYFASRKGLAGNPHASADLTWPEGNAFLARQLEAQGRGLLLKGMLATEIRMSEAGVEVLVFDKKGDEYLLVKAQRAILCTPPFVSARLLHKTGLYPVDTHAFVHAPWITASITIKALPEQKGMPLCWDNVLYGTASVGYIDNSHQLPEQSLRKVLSYYLPIAGTDPRKAREEVAGKDHAYWRKRIIDELEPAHPGIHRYIEQLDVWVWGHGMIAPVPGFISGQARRLAAVPLDNKLFFAHTDLSGISIFEEAFYQGLRTADALQATL